MEKLLGVGDEEGRGGGGVSGFDRKCLNTHSVCVCVCVCVCV